MKGKCWDYIGTHTPHIIFIQMYGLLPDINGHIPIFCYQSRSNGLLKVTKLKASG